MFMTAALSFCAAMIFSCADKSTNGVIVKGNLSEMDTLSYVTGIDLGSSLQREMGLLGFNYDVVKEGIEKAAFSNKPYVVQGDTLTRESAVDILRGFFMGDFQQRMQQKHANELAKQDTTGTAKIEELDFNPETMFKSDEECNLISSAFGYDIGNNMVSRGLPLHLVWVFKGWDEVRNNENKMTAEEAQNWLREFYTVKLPAQNKKDSEAWLSEVEKESGVKKTESGLLYKIVEEGDMSAKPQSIKDVVEVHYKGTTRKGKVFDASRFADMPEARKQMLKRYRPNDFDKDEPVKFPLNGVIKGWGEGLQLVGKGGKITLWIPSELAYGERGAGQDIAPNEALRFDVELINVEPAAVEVPAETAPAE